MTDEERLEILARAKTFFRARIAGNHITNTLKLARLSAFAVNPFILKYLANFFTGNQSAESMAKCLVYPRVLGTSITTSFGSNIQYFCSEVLGGFASAIPGIDIEFVDQVDQRRKYCQAKAGPNTINSSDIVTIRDHFNGIRNIARVNHLDVRATDLVVGVFYGERDELSQNYLALDREYPVYEGQNFWNRLTGEPRFYFDLINAFGEIAVESNAVDMLQETIRELAAQIEAHGY